MITSVVFLAALASTGQKANISQHATIAMLPGVKVMRNGSMVQASGSVIELQDGDSVTVNSPTGERYTMICPDNSVVTFHSGAAFRIEDPVRGREEYVLTKGKFDIWSCPHGAPPGCQEVSFRTCCLRLWYNDQMSDVRTSVQVVGHENCIIKTTSGIVWKQKTQGATPVGSAMRG
ncbi:MAG: hypothetical protein ABL949_00700 [Fimbriimonadaceae bacterium]